MNNIGCYDLQFPPPSLKNRISLLLEQAGKQAAIFLGQHPSTRGFFQTGAGVVFVAAIFLGQHRFSTRSLLGRQKYCVSNGDSTISRLSNGGRQHFVAFSPQSLDGYSFGTAISANSSQACLDWHWSRSPVLIDFLSGNFLHPMACQAPPAWSLLLRHQNNFEIP